jgi:hypothetical protein
MKVFLRHVPTGETRIWETDLEWHEHSDYLWAEGNFACDCNRRHFWGYAIGEEYSEAPCGDDEFAVDKIEVDGKVVYTDEDPYAGRE